MHTRLRLYTSLEFALSVLALSACSSTSMDNKSAGAVVNEDLSLVLQGSVEQVIIPTYQLLHARAADMATCVSELAATPTEAKLTDCKNAWVAARVPWEQSEGFLFGPVEDQGLDPAMDSWPVDHQQLEALLASTVALSSSSITDNLGGGLKGFHTIEYLLWGDNQTRTAASLAESPRNLEYLIALTETLSEDTLTLDKAWSGTEDTRGYGERFETSGTTSGLYASQVDAVQELLHGMIDICDEVANEKLANPYKERNPDLIESQFSYNSLLDFADNIRSVKNVYTATYNSATGESSIAQIVAQYDAELNTQLASQLDTAIAAILAIGEGGINFRDAILDQQHDAVIEKAQTEVATLMNLLSSGVLPLFAR